ncbi:histone-lysine N-methyltransferase, H3 lysine-79 specific-like [Amyelois transitella]|uniref:histone-lysine N-methyltransferase, H3 lysine-79 specific-like n=1 Tax=Amyelois transitella TaxID=680683 RepID=UPI00299043C6|nr:histone-lysine N-methyltransferase, H3 lysine-79 specific-like [Amyelois transitella]
MNLKREDFAPVLKTALESITESSVKNGFRAGGLYPFGPDYVDLSKIKSRNKKEASSEQILFFDYLEKEIVAKLQKEKLQIFNDLYYKDRQNLNIHLNEEDLSLYIIWASNKQAIELSGHVNEQSTSPQTLVEIPNPNEINPAESLSATNADTDVQYQFDIQLDHDYLPHITLSNAGYDATTSTCTPNDAPKSREILDNSLTVASPSSNLNDPIPTTSTSCSYTFMFDIATKITPSKELTRPGNSQIGQSSAEKTPVKELTRPETSKINQSSIKKTPLKELAIPGTTKFIQKKGESTYIIPSPFKRNLFWPGEDENKGKKRKLKEKIPFVITSKPWREYNERKDIEKKEKEKQKEIKAKEREERRLLKLRETEEKKKRQMEKEIKTKEGKKIKKSKPDDTSSDNTDIEVHYAESEDSLDMQIDAEKTEHEKSESSTQSEDVPLIRFSKKSRKYSIGNYVIIRYEGEYFPGVIEVPKAATRKKNQPNRRKIKSAVLTNTPIKNEIAAIEEKRKLKSMKKRVLTEKEKKPKKANKINKKGEGDLDEDAENDCFCLCCLEPYENSRSNEKWVQCLECKGWFHEDCTGGELQYVCHNCLSD